MNEKLTWRPKTCTYFARDSLRLYLDVDRKNEIYFLNETRIKNEPRHDKTNKMSVCPAKTQINLGIRQVWSESLLCA